MTTPKATYKISNVDGENAVTNKEVEEVGKTKFHKLKAARELSAKTQAQVAKELGIDLRLYQRYEYNEITPTAITANRIARYFNTTSEILWGF